MLVDSYIHRSAVKLRLDGGILLQDRLMILVTLILKLLCECGILDRQHLDGEQCCILCGIDTDCGNRNSRWHHDRGKKCIHALEYLRRTWDTDHRKCGIRCDGTCEVRGHAGSGDDDTEAIFTCGFRELCSLLRCSVGTVYMNFNRYSVLLQYTDAFFNYWKI